VRATHPKADAGDEATNTGATGVGRALDTGSRSGCSDDDLSEEREAEADHLSMAVGGLSGTSAQRPSSSAASAWLIAPRRDHLLYQPVPDVDFDAVQDRATRRRYGDTFVVGDQREWPCSGTIRLCRRSLDSSRTHSEIAILLGICVPIGGGLGAPRLRKIATSRLT
jgi:hypothetical protein